MAAAPGGDRRLEQLYEISKLFAAFDGAEHTLDEALKVIADKLPLESAILIEAVIGGHTDMVVWPCRDGEPALLRAAKTHALDAYAYLVGARPLEAATLRDGVREEQGSTELPAPDRAAAPLDAGRRFIVLPLVVGRGAVFGALQLEGVARLERRDLEFVNAIANQLAIALDRNRAWSHERVLRREAQRLQARYETLVDHLDFAFVWAADPETHQLSYVSAQVERMFGYPRESFTDERDWWSAHVPPEDRDQLRQTIARAVAERGNKRCEHRCLAADGSVRWLRTSIHLVGSPGEPPQLQGVSFDITAARLAQDQVREQLSFTSAMASSLAEGTLAVDLEGRITFINDAGAGLLGCRGHDVLGQRSAELVHIQTADGKIVESPLAAATRTGRVRNAAHVIVRNDGRQFAASYTATPIKRDGVVTGAVLAFDDIAEQQQGQEAEHLLLHAGGLLNASLEADAVALAAARCGVPLLGDVCFVDLMSADDQLVHAAWMHADPAVYDELADLIAAGPRAPVFATPIAELIASGQSLRAPLVPDAWFSVADLAVVRRLAIHSALIVPLVVGARRLGAVTFCMTGDRYRRASDVALAEELARRIALAIEHAQLYGQARHAVALREQTLAIVSHDLRSPLATIVMAAALLDEEPAVRANVQSRSLAVEKIQAAAERMNRMIGDLLDFASIEAGQLSLTAAPHAVAGIIEESLSSFEATARKRHVRLTADVAADLPPIQCDRDRILQVLANLTGNALQSVATGDSVRLSAKRLDRDVVFSVSDTGPGIAIAHQKRLFERYWRSPDAIYKGTGLGLAIARGLIEAHHGRLWVESEPGSGATFWFTVPLAEPASRRNRDA
jgi:PAS domain S-box-containing protein